MATSNSHHDPVHCIWMDAGVVGYKLCDLDLQCDRCPFDQNMRRPAEKLEDQAAPPVETAPAVGLDAAARVTSLFGAFDPGRLPEDRLYHSGHLWVKPLMESIVVVGIDHIAASMIGSLGSVVLPSRQTRLIHRMPWCWLIHHEGAISLYAPVHGLVVEANSRILEHPELVLQDPYGDGWLVHVQVVRNGSESAHLLSRDQYMRRSTRELAAIETRVLQNLKKSPSVGQTMHDGGQPAETIAVLIGPRAFFDITSTLFLP